MKPVALATGASRGIGRGIAAELAARRSHDIVINFAGNAAAAAECRQPCLAGTGEVISVDGGFHLRTP